MSLPKSLQERGAHASAAPCTTETVTVQGSNPCSSGSSAHSVSGLYRQSRPVVASPSVLARVSTQQAILPSPPPVAKKPTSLPNFEGKKIDNI